MICDVKGVPVYYESFGSGTPVLMIHGWGPDHRLMKGCMEPVFDRLNQDWQRIYFDLPGMGKTPGRPWITGSVPMLEIITGLTDSLFPNCNFLIAGESYGGYLSRKLVSVMPSRIDGMLLICPSFRPWIKTEEGFDKGDVPEPVVLEKDEELWAALSPEERIFFESCNPVLTKEIWARFKEEILPGLRSADSAFLENYLSREPFFSDPVDCFYEKPVTILTGRQDFSVGYRDQFSLLDYYPRASFAVLDRAGHNLQIDQPELFRALVSEWLGRTAVHQ